MSTKKINWKKWTLNKILILVTIVSTIVSVLFKFESCKWQSEADRYKNNYSVQCSQTKTYKDRNGILVTQVDNLSLTVQDLKNSKDSSIRKLMAEVMANGDVMRKLKSVNEVLMETNAEFQTKTNLLTMFNSRDSIIKINDTTFVEQDTFSDNWISYSRIKIKGSDYSNVKITTYHDLILTTKWYKEGSWKIQNLWKWRKRKFATDCKDLSPYSKIRSLKVIDIKR